MDNCPNNSTAEIVRNLILQGIKLEENGAVSAAIKSYEKALDFNLTDVSNDLLLRISMLHQKLGKLNLALDYSRRLATREKLNPSQQAKHINLLVNLGFWEEAVRNLNTCLQADARNLEFRRAASKIINATDWSPSDIAEICGPDLPTQNLPITRWSVARELQGMINEFLKFHPKLPENNSGKNIAILGIYPWWIYFILPLSLILRHFGHKIHVIWHPTLEIVYPEDEWERELFKREIAKLADLCHPMGIHFIGIDGYDKELPAELKAEVEEQNIIDVAPPFTLEDKYIDGADHPTFEAFRRQRNLSFAKSFHGFLTTNEFRFDHWIIHDGLVWEWAVAYRFLKQRNAKTVSLDFPAEIGRIAISADRPNGMFVLDTAWRTRLAEEFSDDQESWVSDWILAVENAAYHDKSRSMISFQVTDKSEAATTIEELGLDNRQVHLVLPNVPWDAFVLLEHTNCIFPNLQDWMYSVIEFYIDRPQVQMVLRCHPAEYQDDTPYNTIEMISDRWNRLPDHIKILPLNTDINTYGLVERSDLILSYASDIAWESVLRGKQALMAAKSHFSNKGITIDPKTRVEYFEYLENFINEPSAFSVTNEQTKLVRTYAYFFMREIKKSFPWRINTTSEDLERYPFNRMLNKGIDEYQLIWDVISGKDIPYEGWIGSVNATRPDDKNL